MNIYRVIVANRPFYIELMVTAASEGRARELVLHYLETDPEMLQAEKDEHEMARDFYDSAEEHAAAFCDYEYRLCDGYIEIVDENVDGAEAVIFDDSGWNG